MTTWRNRIKETRTVSAAELRANPQNWRRHPDAQARAIEGLLAEVGIVAPLVAYESERYGGLTLIDGHMRQETGGEWPVTVLDVTDEEADLILATFDPIMGLAEMDAAALGQLLGRVEMMPVEDEGVQALLAALAEESGGDTEPQPTADAEPQIDRAEELREQWGVELGQLWQLGDHRLICGDCTDADVVARVMGGGKIDCITTDPPYGVDYDGGTKAREKLQGDDSPALYFPALSTWKPHCQKHVALYLWYADGDQAVAQAVAQAGWHVRRNLIWNKNQAQYGALSQQYKQKHEPFLYCHLKGESPYWGGNGAEVTVWDIDRHTVNEFHPTQKPPALFGRAIENSSKRGDVVFDGFLGSGTTIIACEQLGRKCRAVELSPAYVAVALQRWHDATGREPVLMEAG